MRLAPLSTLLALELEVIQLVLLAMLKLLNVLRWSLHTRWKHAAAALDETLSQADPKQPKPPASGQRAADGLKIWASVSRWTRARCTKLFAGQRGERRPTIPREKREGAF